MKKIISSPTVSLWEMMSELEQEVVAGIEGLSGTTQESLINSVKGEERCFKQRRANLSPKGEIRWELHDVTIAH